MSCTTASARKENSFVSRKHVVVNSGSEKAHSTWITHVCALRRNWKRAAHTTIQEFRASFYGVPSVKDEIACNLAEIACNLAKLQISCNLAKLHIPCNLAKLHISCNLAELQISCNLAKLHISCNLAKLHISCNLAKLHISCNLAKLHISCNLAKLHSSCNLAKLHISCNLAKLQISCNLAKLQISCNLAKLQISCNLAKLQITCNLAKLLQFVKLHCNCHGYGLWNVANQNCRKNCIWNQAFRGSRTVRYCRKTRPNVWMLSDGCSCSDVCLAERFKGQVIVRLFSLIN